MPLGILNLLEKNFLLQKLYIVILIQLLALRINKLEKIDIVINASGVLTSSHANNIENVHINGPKALFKACTITNVKRIIHISALGIDDEENTSYALTKKVTERYLQKLENIDWVVLQPSLIYASGCYGGTSLFRAFSNITVFYSSDR
ncbi:Putative oxidoreductase protein [Rickettsia bellii RML369-C]|uniref:Putative oxidoreductase protein n=1 Tax=Rickettsia bellii (strain RML369-C) TaxID=336407 RepID=Q1RGW7_RICBR|nr:Putative oxidoreductase protein [Rickettsia bellii RML369-C]